MKSNFFTKTIIVLLVFFTFALSASAQNRYGGSYAKGVELFYAKDYAGAITEFEKAEADNPANHAAYLWHGLAFAALGDFDGKGSNIWLKMPYDEKWKSTYRFFMGLGYWQTGYTNSAKYWFEETMKHPEVPAAKLAQTALKSLLNDGEAPPIEMWATIASLPGAKAVKDSTAGSAANEKSNETTDSDNTETKQTKVSGANPSGGLWSGTISNGYTGQKITFRVSTSGKTISDIAFEGYIRCSGLTENTRLAPLESVAVADGSFSKTELQKPQIRFDFNGAFTSATSAKGIYRVQSGTNCDTYELKWTASRVGE